jgi:hypothetical protein
MFSHTAMDELTGIDGRLSSKRNIELRKFMVEEKTRAVARDGEQGTQREHKERNVGWRILLIGI